MKQLFCDILGHGLWVLMVLILLDIALTGLLVVSGIGYCLRKEIEGRQLGNAYGSLGVLRYSFYVGLVGWESVLVMAPLLVYPIVTLVLLNTVFRQVFPGPVDGQRAFIPAQWGLKRRALVLLAAGIVVFLITPGPAVRLGKDTQTNWDSGPPSNSGARSAARSPGMDRLHQDRLRRLKDANPEERAAAAIAISAAVELSTGKALAKSVVPELLPLLRDKEWKVRRAAAHALRMCGTEAQPAVPILIEWLRDPSPEVRVYAANALGAIGPGARSAVPALRGLCEDKDMGRWATIALESIEGRQPSQPVNTMPNEPGRHAQAALPVVRSQAPAVPVRPSYQGVAFVISPSGHLLTAGHVVRGAAEIAVRLTGGGELPAEVVAIHDVHDVALLKIKAEGLPTIPVADIEPPANTPVTAFGYPLTARDHQQLQSRRTRTLGRANKGASLLHTHAPLNPGITGGPLVDDHGDVVGVVNAKAAGPGLAEGSYAVATADLAAWLRQQQVDITPGGTPATFDAATIHTRLSPAIGEVMVAPQGPDSLDFRPVKPQLVYSVDASGDPRATIASPDGTTVAVIQLAWILGSQTYHIQIRDPETGALKRTLSGHQGGIWSLAYSPDSATLASASVDQTVILWDVATGRMKQILKGHTNEVTSVAFSPDGRHVASMEGPVGFNVGPVLVWDTKTGQRTQAITSGFRHLCMAFSPKSGLLLLGGLAEAPECMGLWDIETGAVVRRVSFLPSLYDKRPTNYRTWNTLGVQFSPSGSLVACYTGGGPIRGVFILDADSMRIVYHLGDFYQWRSIRFSPDGHLLGVSYVERILVEGLALYDLPSGSQVWNLLGNDRNFCFTADSRGIIGCNDIGKTIQRWDISFLSRMGQKMTGLPPQADEGVKPVNEAVAPVTASSPEKPEVADRLPGPDHQPPEQPEPSLIADAEQLDQMLAEPDKHRVIWVRLSKDQVGTEPMKKLNAWVEQGGVLWLSTDLAGEFGFPVTAAPEKRTTMFANPSVSHDVLKGLAAGTPVTIGHAPGDVLIAGKRSELAAQITPLLAWSASVSSVRAFVACAERKQGQGVAVFRPREIDTTSDAGRTFEENLRTWSFTVARPPVAKNNGR